MSPKDLDQIAHRLIADKIGAGEIVQMHWAVTELINSQGGIVGDGESFYSLCAREHVYRIVKKAVSKYDKSESGDGVQMTLDGYECLQEAYTVEREDERQLVPVHLVTNDELLARAKEFRKQAHGLLNHAREIEKYVSDRGAGGVGISA